MWVNVLVNFCSKINWIVPEVMKCVLWLLVNFNCNWEQNQVTCIRAKLNAKDVRNISLKKLPAVFTIGAHICYWKLTPKRYLRCLVYFCVTFTFNVIWCVVARYALSVRTLLFYLPVCLLNDVNVSCNIKYCILFKRWMLRMRVHPIRSVSYIFVYVMSCYLKRMYVEAAFALIYCCIRLSIAMSYRLPYYSDNINVSIYTHVLKLQYCIN